MWREEQSERRQMLGDPEGHGKDLGYFQREEGALEGSEQNDTVELRLSQDPSDCCVALE